MRLSVLIFAGLLAACGSNPPAGDANSHEAQGQGNAAIAASPAPPEVAATGNAAADDTASSTAADEAAIRAILDKLFAGYKRGVGGFENPPAFSPALSAAWNKIGEMDGDPYCGCQDWDASVFRYRIKSVTIEGDKARGVVEILRIYKDDMEEGDKTGGRWFDFIRSPKGWLLDDMGFGNTSSIKDYGK